MVLVFLGAILSINTQDDESISSEEPPDPLFVDSNMSDLSSPFERGRAFSLNIRDQLEENEWQIPNTPTADDGKAASNPTSPAHLKRMSSFLRNIPIDKLDDVECSSSSD